MGSCIESCSGALVEATKDANTVNKPFKNAADCWQETLLAAGYLTTAGRNGIQGRSSAQENSGVYVGSKNESCVMRDGGCK